MLSKYQGLLTHITEKSTIYLIKNEKKLKYFAFLPFLPIFMSLINIASPCRLG